MSRDTQGVMNIVSTFQVPRSRFGYEGVLKILNKRMTLLFNQSIKSGFSLAPIFWTMYLNRYFF